MRQLCFYLLSAYATLTFTTTLTNAFYATNRDATTAALFSVTKTVLETLYPVDNNTAPFPPTLQPLDRRYIDTVFHRHLGHGVTPTYLRVIETIGDANEFLMVYHSGRNSNKFWHRFTEDGKLSMNISDRYISEWRAAAIRAISTSQHFEARVLVGQALHIIQDGFRGANGSLTETAGEAAKLWLLGIRGAVSTPLMRDFLGIHSRKRGRELVVVVDDAFRDRGGVDRLRAIARWAADFAANAPTTDSPSKFTIYLFGSVYSVYPADGGLQLITELMNRMVENCLENTTTNLVCPEAAPGENINDPRGILPLLDEAARHAEIGSTIALFTDARFSTNPRMHVPLLHTKSQQLIIVGDPPYSDDRPIYNSLAEKTGGSVVHVGRFVDEIYPFIGFLDHASKENVVLVAAVDFSLQNEIETEVELLLGDVPLGIYVRPDSFVGVDITSNGSYQSYVRGAWISAPPNITGTWKFKVKSGTEGILGWSFKAYIQSDIFHNMGIYQYVDVTEGSAFANRQWNHRGYFRLLGNPTINTHYSILLTTPQCENCESQPLNIELIGERGNLVENGTASEINNQYLAVDIRIPFQPFRIVVSGMHQGKRYKRYSPRLIRPTIHSLEVEWNRPIDVITPDSRTGGSVFYIAPENSTARLETKEYLNFLSPLSRADHPSKNGNKYRFNITFPAHNTIIDQVDEMVFVVLSENEGISGDNHIVQYVSVIDGVRPSPPKCTISESTHGTCALNSGCDNYYNAKVRIVDDYDGFQYHYLNPTFTDTWEPWNGITTVRTRDMFLDTDGKYAMTKEVKNAQCCKVARVVVTDANYEDVEVCTFFFPTAGASGITGIVTLYIVASIVSVFIV